MRGPEGGEKGVENPNAIDLVVEVAKEAAELAPALVLSSSVVAA
jgi:hypothetical protein